MYVYFEGRSKDLFENLELRNQSYSISLRYKGIDYMLITIHVIDITCMVPPLVNSTNNKKP